MTDQPTETPEPAETEPVPSTSEEGEGEGEAEATPGLVTRLGIVGFVRLLIGFAGLGGFVIGVIVAWHSASATTLLIVSGILLVLAALGLDWSEIRGTGPGGWTVQLLRSVEDRIGKVAGGENVPPAIREELEMLRAEVKALTPQERPPRRRRPSGQIGATTSFQDLFRTRATHSFRRPGSVELVLRRPGSSQDSRYRCNVKTPTNNAFHAIAGPIGIPTLVTNYTATYPDDFEGSEPLVPGRYEVEWRSAPLVDPLAGGRNLLAAQLAQTATPPVATDSFTIPEAGGWQPEAPRTPETPEAESSASPEERAESPDSPS